MSRVITLSVKEILSITCFCYPLFIKTYRWKRQLSYNMCDKRWLLGLNIIQYKSERQTNEHCSWCSSEVLSLHSLSIYLTRRGWMRGWVRVDYYHPAISVRGRWRGLEWWWWLGGQSWLTLNPLSCIEKVESQRLKEHGNSCIGIFYEKYCASHITWHSWVHIYCVKWV